MCGHRGPLSPVDRQTDMAKNTTFPHSDGVVMKTILMDRCNILAANRYFPQKSHDVHFQNLTSFVRL